MTEPSPERPSTADSIQQPESSQGRPPAPPSFAPIFTLVDNASTQTTHHPQVRYIFSDDDPDILTQALANLDPSTDEHSSSNPASNHRAAILDLASEPDGGFKVAWASSLSPSWAVLDAQLTRISPPSSDGGGSHEQSPPNRLDRLMLRIEGNDSDAIRSDGDLGLSGEGSRPGSGHTSGAGSGHNDRGRLDEDGYGTIVSEFEKRMVLLRRVATAGEERRKLVGANAQAETTDTAGRSHSPAD